MKECLSVRHFGVLICLGHIILKFISGIYQMNFPLFKIFFHVILIPRKLACNVRCYCVQLNELH
jgi:hypothetical protein